ncbi:tripartite motif-containing protein 2-like [Lingula anatina]|uniref:Tripartite motif-containing protein 2-like n=1 Tax=Lingula anatina TaxID=7574 RepID=A0A1S3KG51_LINAN|nr:tripartite motif-containing protein 2-like [Lingula anatina]|eukprot:XP_013421467.1 tripartite motif-containing protein 2-like [Lingula anatina]
MALSKILEEDFLTCIICEERYEEPKILPCVHSFCKRCLEDHVNVKLDRNRRFPCPICRRECELPEKGAEDLENSRLLANLAEVVNKVDEAKTQDKCETCALKEPPVDADATKRCLKCDDNMCDACSAEHRRHGGCRDHQLIPLGELNDEAYASELRSRQQIRCNHDNETPAKVFCFVCEKFICGTCVSLEHTDHDCKYIPSAAKGGRERLATAQEEIGQQETIATSLLSVMKLLKTGLHCQNEELKRSIRNRQKELITLLIVTGDRMCKEVEETTNQVEEVLDPIEKELELIQGCFWSFREFTNALIIHGSDPEVLQTMANCLRRGRELTEMRLPTIPTTKTLTLDTKHVNNMSTVLRECMGEVRHARDKELLWSFCVDLNTDPPESVTHVAVDAEGRLCVGVWCFVKRNKINVYDVDRCLIATITNPELKAGSLAGITLDQDGNVVARSQSDNLVMIFSREGKLLSSFHSSQPLAVSVNSKGQYVIAGREAIYIHDKDGQVAHSFPDPLQGDVIKYVAVSVTGDILVSHPGAHKVLAYNPVSGVLKFTYGDKGCGDGQVNEPKGMCCLANGDIILADDRNNRLHLLSPDGVFKKFLLTKENGMKFPKDVALTPDGKVVVVENGGAVKCFAFQDQETTI